jgi:hypothetical protein
MYELNYVPDRFFHHRLLFLSLRLQLLGSCKEKQRLQQLDANKTEFSKPRPRIFMQDGSKDLL